MRVVFFILFTIVSCAGSGQDRSFELFADSLGKELACTQTDERDLPGVLKVLFARHFLTADFTLGFAPHPDQHLAPILSDKTYTTTFEEFNSTVPYTAMATLFPEEKLRSGSVRKLVSFADFVKGPGPIELTLYGFRGPNNSAETVAIWKKLPDGECKMSHFKWMPGPAIDFNEMGIWIRLDEECLTKGAITIEIIDTLGRTVLVQRAAEPQMGIEVNTQGILTGDYLLQIKDAGKTIFTRYFPTSSF